HRLRQRHPRRPHRPVPIGVDPVPRGSTHGALIGPRAEGPARPPEHRDSGIGVRIKRPERISERHRSRSVDSVPNLRPLKYDSPPSPRLLYSHSHASSASVNGRAWVSGLRSRYGAGTACPRRKALRSQPAPRWYTAPARAWVLERWG